MRPQDKGPSAAAVISALLKRYPSPEWATFRELAHQTGAGKVRKIDLFAQNLYPSKGLMSVAVEVKVSRSDFRKELDDPGKRLPWESIATECWFAAPSGVIPVAELPEGWGLMETTKGGGLRRKRAAMQRTVETLSPSFVASMTRRCGDPAVDPAAWEIRGRPVRYSELLRLANRAYSRAYNRDLARKLTRLQQLEGELTPQIKEWRKQAAGILAAVQKVAGWQVQTKESLEAWLLEQKSSAMGQQERRSLQNMKRTLEQLLGPS